MLGGDELTEYDHYDLNAYDDDFPGDIEAEECSEISKGCEAIGPFTAFYFAADFLAENTSRQR